MGLNDIISEETFDWISGKYLIFFSKGGFDFELIVLQVSAGMKMKI